MGALFGVLKFLLPVVAAGLLGFGALFLVNARHSPARNWILATNYRIAMLGAFALFLLWILLATYQQITSI